MVKNLLANARVSSSVPGSGRSPGEGNGYQLQCSCLENPMDRGAWRAMVHGGAKSRTRLSTHTHTQGKVFHKEEMLNEENLRNH